MIDQPMVVPGEGDLERWKSIIAPSMQPDGEGGHVSLFRATPTLRQGVAGEYASSVLLGRSENGIDNWQVDPDPLEMDKTGDIYGDIEGLGDEDDGLQRIPEGSLPEEFDEYKWAITSNTATLKAGEEDPAVRAAIILANEDFTHFKRYPRVLESFDPTTWRIKGLNVDPKTLTGGNIGYSFTLGSELPGSRIVHGIGKFEDLLGIGEHRVTPDDVSRMYMENALIIPPAGNHRGTESGPQKMYIEFEGTTYPAQVFTGADMRPYKNRSWVPGLALFDPEDETRLTHVKHHLIQAKNVYNPSKSVVKRVAFAKSSAVRGDEFIIGASVGDLEPRIFIGSVKHIMQTMLRKRNGKDVYAYNPPKPY
ncbi:MAG TPA: hypothetical protein VLG16_05985 [Candidatus Saccharimonadales bacterium]|nr:hypothetical protein [Candidatus Saccharimonadales bacterium]